MPSLPVVLTEPLDPYGEGLPMDQTVHMRQSVLSIHGWEKKVNIKV